MPTASNALLWVNAVNLPMALLDWTLHAIDLEELIAHVSTGAIFVSWHVLFFLSPTGREMANTIAFVGIIPAFFLQADIEFNEAASDHSAIPGDDLHGHLHQCD